MRNYVIIRPTGRLRNSLSNLALVRGSPNIIHSTEIGIFRCKVAFYTNRSELSQRKTSFGFGNKIDFTRTVSCSPPPTRYNSKSFVEESKNLGKTFGTSRDYTPGRSYMMPQLNTPGPSDVIDLLFSTMERNCCQTVPHTACYQGERTSWRVRKAIILTQDLLPTVS